MVTVAELHGKFVFLAQLMAICRRRVTKFFPDDRGFTYSLSKASGSKYMQFRRNHPHFLPIYVANT